MIPITIEIIRFLPLNYIISMVSVIIPAYNASKYIEETIQSVLNQTYQNFEIIVVNDGSTDNTEGIIAGIMRFDKRIQLINKKNTGVSDTRNIGMQCAKGEYIALLDADDTWEYDNLSLKSNILTTYDDISWVYSDMYEADENLHKMGIAANGKTGNTLELILKWEGEVVPGPCSNIVFRKKCIEDGCSFDKALSTAADQDFTLQLASKYKSCYINKPLWNYRILSNSMSRNIAVMEKDHIGVYKKAEKNNLFKSFLFKQQCFSNLYLILAGSWYVNGKNKQRAIFFALRSILTYPPNIIKLIAKIL